MSLRPRARGLRGPGVRYRDVPGLSGAANNAVRVWERERWSPGAVAAAFGVWSVRVHGDRRRLRPWEAEHSCVCCGRGWARDQLERAVAMLPARAASELRAAVAELDAVLLRRTHHDPQSSEELAWWHRRC